MTTAQAPARSGSPRVPTPVAVVVVLIVLAALAVALVALLTGGGSTEPVTFDQFSAA